MISNALGLPRKTDNKIKITDVENKIPSVTGLATTTGLNNTTQRLKTKYWIILM